MTLHELLRRCFTDSECRILLSDQFEDVGRDVWDGTDGDWLNRSSEIVEALRRRSLVDRRLFEALVRARPGRADDISAVCRSELGQPFNYAVGSAPPARAFPWSDYEQAMTPSLIRTLRCAAYDARSRGHATISTSEIFRVYRARQPWLGAAFPPEVLEASDLEGEEDPFGDAVGASYCVSLTIHGLAQQMERPNQFDEHDVFLDLARFGNGGSARRLSPDGDALEHINELSRALNIGRVTRHGRLDDDDA